MTLIYLDLPGFTWIYLDLPGFRLHPLKGDMKELWSIDVNKNWRITFEFKAGDVYVVNYEDYH